MKTILVPLHASEIALDPTGPDIAEFTVDAAVSQVWAILAALGDRAEEFIKEFEFLKTPEKQREKMITFYSEREIEVDGKRVPLASTRYALLKIVYESKNWAVSFTEASAKIWITDIVDEDVIKQMIYNTNKCFKEYGVGLRLFQKRLVDDFFICLDVVTEL